mmetsp:Transcript_28506/g.59943  ORF Transcript_28506/g.59943 Transcript_28506/m.59943 type:complete len:238 (+) Transcript_28506:277-990(+)
MITQIIFAYRLFFDVVFSLGGGEEVGGKRSHEVSVIMRDNPLQCRNRSLDCTFRNESENSNHSKTAVVDFRNKAALLVCIGHDCNVFAGEGVVKVECSSWDVLGIEWGEVSNLSSFHVMGSGGNLAPVFKEPNEENNLELGRLRNCIPGLGGTGDLGEWISSKCHGPRPGNSISMYDISDEGKHGNTSVFDLGLAKETDGSFIALSPKLLVGKSKRVEERDDRVQFLCKDLEVGLGL